MPGRRVNENGSGADAGEVEECGLLSHLGCEKFLLEESIVALVFGVGYCMALKRSKNRLIAGVCGGIAEWLGWDPTIVRLAYVLISVFSAAFPGIIVYLILWVIMPSE